MSVASKRARRVGPMARRAVASFRVVGTALRTGPMRAVLIAFVLFSVAEWVRWVGLLVYGFDKGGAAGSGFMSLMQLLPAAVITPFTSSLADRYQRPRVLAVVYVVSGLGTAGAGVAIALDAPFLVVAALSAVGLCGVTMVRPTQASLMPQLARTPEELTAANAGTSLIAGGSLFVGPAIASLILAAFGPTSTTGPIVVVLVAGSMLLLGSVFVVSTYRGTVRDETTPERVDLLGGFRELARNRGAGLIVALIGVHAAVWGMVEIFVVTLAIEQLGLGPSGVGGLSAALGVGALIGGGATLTLVGRQRLAPSFAFGVALWSAPLVVLGIAGAPVVVVALLALAGAGLSFLDVSGKTLLQRTVSDEALGRVFGVLESGFMAAWALGSAVAAIVLEVLGIEWAFVAAAVIVPIATAIGWRQLVKADRDATLPGPELDLLRSIAMFRLLSESVLERLARNTTEVPMAAGARIITEGDPGDLFYVIAEGEVLVTITGSEVARYGSGDYFGEIALLRDVPRQASVTALTDVRLLSLERGPFLAALTGSDSAAAAAHSEIGRRLGRTAPK